VRKTIIVPGVIAGVVLLAGCGGQGSSASAPPQPVRPAVSTTVAKPTPTPKPTPRVLTRAEAAKAYEAMVKPSNAAIFALVKLLDGKAASQVSLTKVKAAAASCLTSYRAAIVTASETLWPANIRSDMPDLVKDLGAYVSLCNQLLPARSATDALNIWNTTDFGAASSNTAEVIRAKLGLPPVPNS
jgi:hypothetical protein